MMRRSGNRVAQSQATPPSLPARRYDKGERRHKHSGREATASVDLGNPKKVVGKCPNNIAQSLREELLQKAIVLETPDAGSNYDKYLYLTYEGIVYECATSDFGTSYHAYPYHGKMLSSSVEKLRVLPDAKAHPDAFQSWVDDHVKTRG